VQQPGSAIKSQTILSLRLDAWYAACNGSGAPAESGAP